MKEQLSHRVNAAKDVLYARVAQITQSAPHIMRSADLSFVRRGRHTPTVPKARISNNTVPPPHSAMTPAEAVAIAACLSVPRLATYMTACNPVQGEDATVAALRLYRWNIEISAALMVPIHLCEVAIRNAVSDALTKVYGPQWPWSPGFAQALPNPHRGYSPRRDLATVAQAQPTTGKVIPELKFVFWEKMFTTRHDGRLWNQYLNSVLPNLDRSKTVAQLRDGIRTDLGEIRILRNRIAHHEPIFTRQLANDFARLRRVIEHRSAEMRDWLDTAEAVTRVIAAKP